MPESAASPSRDPPSPGGEDRTIEAAFELRDESAVVDMRECKNDGLTSVRPEREVAVVEFLLGLDSLEEPAIDQDPRPLRFEKVCKIP